MATSSPLLFFSQSTKRCCSQFWESTKSKFWTEFDCSVSCYWQATTGKLAVEWTLATLGLDGQISYALQLLIYCNHRLYGALLTLLTAFLILNLIITIPDKTRTFPSRFLVSGPVHPVLQPGNRVPPGVSVQKSAVHASSVQRHANSLNDKSSEAVRL